MREDDNRRHDISVVAYYGTDCLGIIVMLIVIFVLLGFLSHQFEYDRQGGEIAITVILIAGLASWIACILRDDWIRNKRLSERELSQRKTEMKSLKDQF